MTLKFLEGCRVERDDFLRIVTGDKHGPVLWMWRPGNSPISYSSKQCQPKNDRTLFWDHHCWLISWNQTKLQRSIQHRVLSKDVVLYNNTWLIQLIKPEWGIFDYTPFNPDMAPSDYHLAGYRGSTILWEEAAEAAKKLMTLYKCWMLLATVCRSNVDMDVSLIYNEIFFLYLFFCTCQSEVNFWIGFVELLMYLHASHMYKRS